MQWMAVAGQINDVSAVRLLSSLQETENVVAVLQDGLAVLTGSIDVAGQRKWTWLSA